MKAIIFAVLFFCIGVVNAGCLLNIEIPKGCDVESIRKQVSPNVGVKALIPGDGEIKILNIVSRKDLAKNKQDSALGQFNGRMGNDGYYTIRSGGPNNCMAWFKMDDSGKILKLYEHSLSATGGVNARLACDRLGEFMELMLGETWFVVPD